MSAKAVRRASLQDMRCPFQVFPPEKIWQTLSAISEPHLKSGDVPIYSLSTILTISATRPSRRAADLARRTRFLDRSCRHCSTN